MGGSAFQKSNGSFGTSAGTICEGNDSRLSNTRNTNNSITFNNSGTGSTSGTAFNGSAAITISYNSIGALANVVGDTAPNLGGNLIVNQKI